MKRLCVAIALVAGQAVLQEPRAAESAFVVAQAEIGTAEGEVRRIDKDAGKVTLRHGPIEAMDMPAMTMVFRVSDPAMLDRLAVGDKVRFTTAKEGGAFTLKSFEKAN